jgi:lycopene beta-cyclase
MLPIVYDLAIIGAGASGLQLAYESIQADASKKLKILLLDSGDRSSKSWCFWEGEENSCFPFLVEKSWKNMTYRSSEGHTKTTDIGPLSYNYISSDRFFSFFFEQFIPKESRITHIQKRAKNIHPCIETHSIECEDGTIYLAKRVADSRPKKSEETSTVFQHFSGKFIEFDQPNLDETNVTLMDFSLPVSTDEMAVFHYILPFSKTKALIETTVFTALPYDKEAYEAIWQTYMKTHYPSVPYKILSTEMGTIPMGNQVKREEGTIVSIGAAGGFMKASTGYAFTRMHQDAVHRANNKPLHVPSRFRFYDTMLLKIMKKEMNKIPLVMDRLFKRVPAKLVLKFLDDKTSLNEEIKLLAQLDIPLFVKHLVK